MNEIIVALITGGVTLVGVLISNQKSQAVDSALTVELVFDSTLFSGVEITH